MARQTAQPPAQLLPRVVHYVDPARRDTTELTALGLAERAVRRAEQRELYADWRLRQAEIAEYDRKFRRFWLGFGAVIGTAVLAGAGFLGWLAWHAVTATALGLLAVPLVVLAAAGVVVGGHRCITIVQHWH